MSSNLLLNSLMLYNFSFLLNIKYLFNYFFKVLELKYDKYVMIFLYIYFLKR
jgi:hypothetical protein